MSDRYRDACFTSFLDTPPVYDESKVTYLIFQQEECPTTGKLHWQGFAQSPNAKTISAWQKALKIGKAHVELRKGPVLAASEYCREKEWNGKDKGQVEGSTREYGTIDLKEAKGKRNDLDRVKEQLDKFKDPDELMEDNAHFGAFARYGKFLREYSSHKKRRKGFEAPEVTVVHGPSGTNKTRVFFDKCEYKDYWDWHPGMGQWFDGYTGQDNVLFDEFRGQLPYGLLLKLTDGYPVRVPVKGGFTNWAPTKITITSPNHPREWYPNLAANDKIDQLLRRINKIHQTTLEDDTDVE